MADIFAGLSSSFATKLLESHTYPLLLQFHETSARGDSTSDEIVIAAGDVTARASLDDGQPGDDMLDVVIESFLVVIEAKNEGGIALKADEIEGDLLDLFEKPLKDETIDVPGVGEKRILDLNAADLHALEAEGDGRSLRGLGKLWKKITNAVKKLGKLFVKISKSSSGSISGSRSCGLTSASPRSPVPKPAIRSSCAMSISGFGSRSKPASKSSSGAVSG